MNFFQNLRRVLTRIKQLPKKLTKNDYLVLGICIVILAIGIVGKMGMFAQEKKIIPTYGGEFVEGIVATNSSEIDSQIQNLIYSSLIAFDKDGNIVPELASEYEIQDGGKKYIFTLKEGILVQEIIDQMKNSEFNLSGASIENLNGKVAITTSSIYSPFLNDLTKPIFSPGPYLISKRDNREIIFKSNKTFVLGEPYINNFKVKIYTNKGELERGFNRGEITSAVDVKSRSNNFNSYRLALPRYMVLFFNLNKDSMKDKELRKSIASSQRRDNPVSLTITTIDGQLQKDYLAILKEKYRPLNIAIVENFVSKDRLEKEIIPNRDYELLLYGIDFGRDPDPFLFWHSSQISAEGQNLSNFKSKSGDKLLEEARLITNIDERKKKYNDFQKILDEETPAIFLEQKKVDYIVNKKIQGIEINLGITPSDRFNNVWKWYIKTKRVAR